MNLLPRDLKRKTVIREAAKRPAGCGGAFAVLGIESQETTNLRELGGVVDNVEVVGHEAILGAE